MGVKAQNPDPSKGKGGYPKWDYLKVPSGTSASAYLAGHPTGTYTHYVGCSKPCRRKMTEGALSCPYCTDGKEPEWSGYTPLYTPEFFRVFVVVKEDHRDAILEYELHTQLLVSRAKDKRAPVVLRPKSFRTSTPTVLDDRKNHEDLLPFLIHTLWKDEVLAKWDRMSSALESTNKSGLVPLITDNLVNAFTKESERTRKSAETAAVNEEFVKGARERMTKGVPSANGHHKPKG